MIPGLSYVADHLDAAEQDRLLSTIDALPWRADLRRRVQHYGWRYDYARKRVDDDLYLGPLPDWAVEPAARLAREGHMPAVADQLIVNEYLPGQGIAAHVDCVPCFGDTVASVSLGSACVMTLTRTGHDPVDVRLEPGGLLVLAGEARYEWRHAIAARKSDVVDGQRLARGRRVSLTYRTVIPSDGDSGRSAPPAR